MRLAWFTPLPPVQSGISAYSADLLPRLADHHEIDVFIQDQQHAERAAEEHGTKNQHGGTLHRTQHLAPSTPHPPSPADDTVAGLRRAGPFAVRSAHDFVSAHYHRAYDLIVYQLGNARCHDYMWPYVLRYPGLVVLHDGQLHHARALMLLTRFRFDDYRAEFAWSHPSADPNAAEYAIGTFEGMSYFLWPMIRPVMTRAIRVAVHNRLLAEALGEAHPETPIDRIRMGVPPASVVAPAFPGLSEVSGPAIGLSPFALEPEAGPADGGSKGPLFTSFGLVTPEKRIPQILRAFAHVLESTPDARLVLVGGTVKHFDAASLAQELGIEHAVLITGYVDAEEHDEVMRSADVCLCMRWPSSRETSASWLRCLAAGKATVINDLEHLVDVPSMDPRDWMTLHASRDALGNGLLPDPDPIAVSIDILDEDHSLRLAMVRLARDAGLRKRLGEAAQAYWRKNHTLDAMVEDYERVLALAAKTPSRTAPPDLPPHLLAEGMSVVKHVTSSIGVEFDW